MKFAQGDESTDGTTLATLSNISRQFKLLIAEISFDVCFSPPLPAPTTK